MQVISQLQAQILSYIASLQDEYYVPFNYHFHFNFYYLKRNRQIRYLKTTVNRAVKKLQERGLIQIIELDTRSSPPNLQLTFKGRFVAHIVRKTLCI